MNKDKKEIQFFLKEYRELLKKQKDDFFWTHSPTTIFIKKHQKQFNVLTEKIGKLDELLKNFEKIVDDSSV